MHWQKSIRDRRDACPLALLRKRCLSGSYRSNFSPYRPPYLNLFACLSVKRQAAVGRRFELFDFYLRLDFTHATDRFQAG